MSVVAPGRGHRPNVVFVMADDHAAHAIGAYGSRINETPGIDRLAREGMRFDACFCTNSICSPSRATILTGTYNHVNGVTTLATPFDARQPAFPAMLQAAGYQTALVGKWHLGHGGIHDPVGFDSWSVLPDQGEYHDPTFLEPGGRRVVRPGYATDVITDLAIEWIAARDRERPFLALVHHKAPHRAWEPAQRHANLYQERDVPEPPTLRDDYVGRSTAAVEARMRLWDLNEEDLKAIAPPGLTEDEELRWRYQRYIKDYLSCVAALDENVGRLLDFLDGEGLADDTIVVYTSDQGFFLGDHGWYDKRFMYEESLRMPLLARYPREVAAGSVSEAMVLNVDFALTICDLAGVSPTSPMQGRSLRPLLRGEAPDDWRQEMYYRYWMHLDGSHGVWAHCGVRTHRYKLVQYYGEALGQPGTTDEPRPEEWELFDLEHDPFELRSVHEDPEYAEVRRDLTARLARLQRELEDAPTVELPIPLPKLAAPRGLRARPGRGQVTLDWEPVEGAAGYIIERSSKADGGWEMLVIGEPEVRPVPHPPFTDTSGQIGREVRYRVAAAASVKDFQQPRSEAVAAAPALDGSAHVAIAIRADQPIGPVHRPWRPMIGSEHLSQLEERGITGGRPIGAEFAEALRLAHEELGVEAVRAHAILGDDLGTYREVDGEPVLDFSGISRNYDRVLDLGLRPIVELGFMPRDLAVDPSKTVFEYRAIVSPPRDWDRWGLLVRELAAHLVERYGRDEVRGWAFEVWNEANLGSFWAGTREEYLRLYDVSAAAVKSVDARLRVGGPATAAGKWVDDFLVHCREAGTPVDFVSTHTYGNAPLDLRPIVTRHGFTGLPQWWTEWGAHAAHFSEVHDSPWSAAFLVRGMASAMGRTEALSYWTVSDHFEELGRGPRLLHGGFGLLSVGNLRKPRWWGLWMLEQLGETRLEVALDGDGAGDMVQAIGSRSDGGRIAVVAWNGTADVSKAAGAPILDRRLSLELEGLTASRYRVRHRRVDARHSNLGAVWAEIGGGADWPDDGQWARLAARDRLDELAPERLAMVDGGRLTLEFDLPMPSVSLVELEPS